MDIYNKLLKGLDWVAGLVDKDLLLWIAIGILGGLFIYQVIWAICIAARKKRNSCCCKVVRLNFFRRWTVVLIAWLFAVFAFLTLSGGTLFIGFGMEAFVLPALFLIIVYLMEAFFWIINRCKCYCSCCEVGQSFKSEVVKADEIEVVKVADSRPVVKDKMKPVAKEYIETAEISSGVKEQVEKQNFTKQNPDNQKFERQNSETVKAANVVSPAEEKVAEKESKAIVMPSVSKVRTGARKDVQESKKVVKEDTADKKESVKEQSDKKIERIEELGAKIERQRQRAEKLTDSMEVQRLDDSYVTQTKAALSGVENTVSRMDDLQRRIEALRKVQRDREVHHTEKHSRDEVVSESVEYNNKTTVEVNDIVASQKEISMAQKTTSQLRQEKETLRQKYDQLQGQLMQMSEDKADVGYYSDSGHFERTGRSENLSKIQAKNKYDTEEVKKALQGLKGAMDELQKHIDMRDD